MRWLRRWIGVALIAAVLIGGWSLKAENAENVAVSFLFGEFQVELWEALLAAFGVGLRARRRRSGCGPACARA